MMPVLAALALLFAHLSIASFGGGNTILPELVRQVVDVHHWMSVQQFGALFALAQVAPGPNMMVVTLVGWTVAGWKGALVSTFAMFVPSSILTGLFLHVWDRFRDRPWRRIVQAGLVPVTVGCVVAGSMVITRAHWHDGVLTLIIALCAIASLATRWHPLVILAAGGLLGMFVLGPLGFAAP